MYFRNFTLKIVLLFYAVFLIFQIMGIIMIIEPWVVQTLTVVSSIVGILCGFLWWGVRQVSWVVRQVSTATHKWTQFEESFLHMQTAMNEMKDTKESFKEEMAKINQRINSLEEKTIQRFEILETLKRTEQFFAEIKLELQMIAGRKIDVMVPDLQGPVIREQINNNRN